MSAELIELVQRLGQPRVLVIGDVMLDRYVWGDAARISQEFNDLGIDHEGVLTDTARPSTVKERYIGRAQHKHPQQMLRVDYETREPVTGEVESDLCAAIEAEVGRADVVL